MNATGMFILFISLAGSPVNAFDLAIWRPREPTVWETLTSKLQDWTTHTTEWLAKVLLGTREREPTTCEKLCDTLHSSPHWVTLVGFLSVAFYALCIVRFFTMKWHQRKVNSFMKKIQLEGAGNDTKAYEFIHTLHVERGATLPSYLYQKELIQLIQNFALFMEEDNIIKSTETDKFQLTLTMK